MVAEVESAQVRWQRHPRRRRRDPRVWRATGPARTSTGTAGSTPGSPVLMSVQAIKGSRSGMVSPRPHPRVGRPRQDGPRRRRGDPPPHRSLRWHRGRDVHRRTAPGPRRDGSPSPPVPKAPATVDIASGEPGRSPALRCRGRSRPPGSSARGDGRPSMLAQACLEKFGGDCVAERPPCNHRACPMPSRRVMLRSWWARAGGGVLRPARVREDVDRCGLSLCCSVSTSSTPTPAIEAATGRLISDIFSTTASPRFPRAGAGRGRSGR